MAAEICKEQWLLCCLQVGVGIRSAAATRTATLLQKGQK